jgi:hypothetical protein
MPTVRDKRQNGVVPGTSEGEAADATFVKQPTPSASSAAGESRAPRSQDAESGKNPGGLAGITGGLLAGLAGQAAILTAVLVYFGWVRAYATYQYFGVDLSALDFSVSDYVLHSVNVAFPMVVVFAVLGACAAYGHEQLRARLRDGERARKVARTSARTGAGLAAAGLILALILSLVSQLAFLGLVLAVIGAALGTYGIAINDRSRGTSGRPVYVIAWGVLVLLLFAWAVTAYANYAGIRTAEQVQSGLLTAPGVVVYASGNLLLSGPGVTMSAIKSPDSEFRFRYDGLRFLVGSGGNDFLLPERWRPDDGSVIVLPATGPGILVQFVSS